MGTPGDQQQHLPALHQIDTDDPQLTPSQQQQQQQQQQHLDTMTVLSRIPPLPPSLLSQMPLPTSLLLSNVPLSVTSHLPPIPQLPLSVTSHVLPIPQLPLLVTSSLLHDDLSDVGIQGGGEEGDGDEEEEVALHDIKPSIAELAESLVGGVGEGGVQGLFILVGGGDIKQEALGGGVGGYAGVGEGEAGPSGLGRWQRKGSVGQSQKVFPNSGKLLKHQGAHSTAPFKCDNCKKSFSSKFKLVRHSLIHSDRRPFSCTVCNRTFHRKDHLKNHFKVHSHSKELFVCSKIDCKKEYTSHLSYKKHLALHAAEEGNLTCQLCHKVFRTKDEVLTHLKVHAGSRPVKNPDEKRFRCESCDRKFFTRKDVRRHEVVHTGMRDFLCQFCPERFGRKDHLIRHIKKLHGRQQRAYQQQQQQQQQLDDQLRLDTQTSAPGTGDCSSTPIASTSMAAASTSIPRIKMETPDASGEQLPIPDFYHVNVRDFLFGSATAPGSGGRYDDDDDDDFAGIETSDSPDFKSPFHHHHHHHTTSDTSLIDVPDDSSAILEDLGSDILEDLPTTDLHTTTTDLPSTSTSSGGGVRPISAVPRTICDNDSSSDSGGASGEIMQLLQQQQGGKLPAFDKIFQAQSSQSSQQKPQDDT